MVTVTPEARATLRTSLGNLVLEFIPDKAPRTCENFVALAHKGFYDGTLFHRIVKDFVVQGGCPHGNGKGGPGYTIRPEFNDTPHVPGTVSMARDNDPHSAGSQFFICAGEARYLDSRYTAFARVVEGLDVLQKLATVPTDIQPKYKEKSVPRDPVYLNGIELQGVQFEDEKSAAEAQDNSAEKTGTESADGEGGGSGEAQQPSAKRSRRGRGRRGKGSGERSPGASGREVANSDDGRGADGDKAADGGKAGDGDPGEPVAAEAARDGDAQAAQAEVPEDKPKARKATRKKVTRKKAARKKPAKDED